MSSLKQCLSNMENKSEKVVIEHEKSGVLIYADVKTILESGAKYLGAVVKGEVVDEDTKVKTITVG